MKQPEEYMESVENTILIPVANAEAMLWAMKQVNETDTEQIKEGMRGMLIAANELSVEMNLKPEFTEP